MRENNDPKFSYCVEKEKHGRSGLRIVHGVPSEMFIIASDRPLTSLQQEKISSRVGKKSRTGLLCAQLN